MNRRAHRDGKRRLAAGAALVAVGVVAVWLVSRRVWDSVADIRGEGFNVVLITLDTTRANYLGCYGHPTIKTPNLDRLAREGTRFEQCVTVAPITLPAHASIMTATYPFFHGVRDNGRFKLHGANVTLAELLTRAGYTTGAQIGSVILNSRYGLDQGFDSYNDVPEAPPKRGAPPSRTRQEAIGRLGTERKADEVADPAVDWLQANAGRKFFLWVHFFDPHWPYEPPPRFAAEHDDRYAGEIAFVDEQIGRVLAELARLGLANKTLVVVAGDHGEGLGQHDEDAHTFFVYDTTMRVPLILWCPGRIPSGRVVAAQVRLVDLATTILAFVGLDGNPNPDAQGVNLLPLLAGRVNDLELEAYGETFRPFYVFKHAWLRCLRADGWKYIHGPSPELYQLAEDPGELVNLAADHPERVAEMRERLRDLIAASAQPYWAGQSDRSLSPEERARLEALGYAMGDRADDSIAPASNELALFEPKGRETKNHTESVRQWSLAAAAFQAGHYPAAEQLYRKLIELEPQVPAFRLKLARAQARQDKADEAMTTLREALRIAPRSARAHFELADLLAGAGRLEEAAQHYRETLAIEPDFPDAQARLDRLLNRRSERPSNGK